MTDMAATIIPSLPGITDAVRGRIVNILGNLPQDIKDKIVEKVKDAPKDEAKDQIAEGIVKTLGKTVGGPFADDSPDRPLAKQIIVDILNRDVLQAIFDITINPEFESKAGDPIKDAPDWHPDGKSNYVPPLPANSPASPAQQPPNAAGTLPSPVPVILPGRISSRAPVIADGHNGDNTSPAPPPAVPQSSVADIPPNAPVIILQAGQPVGEPNPNLNPNPEFGPGTSGSPQTASPDAPQASAPIETPSSPQVPVEPTSPPVQEAPPTRPPAIPAPAPTPAPQRIGPDRDGPVEGPVVREFAGPDHPDHEGDA